MNKNLIILIIIVLAWFLVIRPLSTKDEVVQTAKDVKNDPEEDAESAKEKDDNKKVGPDQYTPYPDSDYVDVSKGFGTVDGIGVDWEALKKKYGTSKTYTN